MRNVLVVALAAVVMFAVGSTALAEPTGYKSDGNPYWTYMDRFDEAAKNQGGYAPFEDSGDTKYLSNPHGDFDTAGNKCKVCHAVHRTEGAYFLLRANTQDDACDYCHIGGSAHSEKTVYNLNDAGRSTINGHTIGASATIPDSSVFQWTEDLALTTTNADGLEITESVKVRRYDTIQNKMFRISRHHGHRNPGDGASGYLRIGPLALSCMNCHQPHNATDLIWKPTELETGVRGNGYKLLRSMPSGSIWGIGSNGGATVDYDEGMRTWKAYVVYEEGSADNAYVDSGNVIRVPETDMSASNTGRGYTIYTEFEGAAVESGPERDPQTVNQYALSPWCADCHNLNIGYWKRPLNNELGFKSHTDRTHPVPFTGASNGPGQCYSCHRNDLPSEPTGSPCETCHFGTGTYRATNDDVDGAGTASDFPHSGQSDSIKLLGNYVGYMDADGNRQTRVEPVTHNALDGVCLRCHTGIGTNH